MRGDQKFHILLVRWIFHSFAKLGYIFLYVGLQKPLSLYLSQSQGNGSMSLRCHGTSINYMLHVIDRGRTHHRKSNLSVFRVSCFTQKMTFLSHFFTVLKKSWL